jgi:hypothetical protein
MKTPELTRKYGKARSTIGEWRAYCRDQGHEIGYGTGEATVNEPSVFGVTTNDEVETVRELWDRAKAYQKKVEERIALRKNQAIELPNEPMALAFLSDVHFGSPNTDYENAEADALLIAATDGMYAEFHGDLGDNWIVPGKLTAQSRNQAMTLTDEGRMAVDWLEIIGESLLVVVAGNHDNWTYQLAGVDGLKNSLINRQVLYDAHEVVWNMRVGPSNFRLKSRHKWRGFSKFNHTHGIEVGWENDRFDIGIGGHTHTGTWCRPFGKDGKRRWAVVTGTYKLEDGYAKQLGMPATMGLGCGAMLFHPDGRTHWCDDLETAADFLAFWRQ